MFELLLKFVQNTEFFYTEEYINIMYGIYQRFIKLLYQSRNNKALEKDFYPVAPFRITAM